MCLPNCPYCAIYGVDWRKPVKEQPLTTPTKLNY